MATKIVVFDPMSSDEIEETEIELERLLVDDYKIVGSVGGNRTGHTTDFRPRIGAEGGMPEYKDYVVLILYKR